MAQKSERHVIRATLLERSDVVARGTEHCWMVQDDGKDFDEILIGDKSSYVVETFLLDV